MYVVHVHVMLTLDYSPIFCEAVEHMWILQCVPFIQNINILCIFCIFSEQPGIRVMVSSLSSCTCVAVIPIKKCSFLKYLKYLNITENLHFGTLLPILTELWYMGKN
jgi:hypothetical protein